MANLRSLNNPKNNMKHSMKQAVLWFTIAAMVLPMPMQALAQLLDTPDADRKPKMILGSGQILAPANTKGEIKGGSAGLKFEEAPIADVVGLVLREIAKVDYVVHPPINGTVTLATQGEVTAEHAMLLLEAALQANGIQMARDSRGVYHIGRPDAIKGIVPSLRQVNSNPLPPGQGAVVVPLKNMGATEMATILRSMAPPEAILRVDALRNIIVMSGTRPQIEGWLDIVNTFDVDLLKGMSVGVFPLKHVSTKDVEAAIRMISGGSLANPARAPASGATPGLPVAPATPNAATTPAVNTDASMLGSMRVLPIENINSILIVTPNPRQLEQARIWIDKLDQPGNGLGGGDLQLFVYPVQNGNAKHLASVLNGLFGNGVSTGINPNAPRAIAPGLQSTTGAGGGFGASAGGFGANSTGAFGMNNTQNQNQNTPGVGVSTVTLASGVRVMADEINNAILVYGSRSEFDKIQNTLKRLDVPPTQVLIEASIIEVTLNDDLKYGLQWVFSDKTRGGLSGNGTLSNLSGGVLGAAAAGFSYSLSNSLGDVRAVINALADKSLVNVISSPSLMVLDNHTATIAVGTQQPVRTSETFINGTANVTSAIQYKDTGVNLAVTPSVNAGNMVTLQINQSVTDVGSQDGATGQRSFLQRQINSKVAVRSGETLVLGGLIRNNVSTDKTGIPYLQDLPIFGNLFGATIKSTARTELLVVITPRVVRNDVDMKAIGQEMRDRMKSLPDLPKPAAFEPSVTEVNAKPVPMKSVVESPQLVQSKQEGPKPVPPTPLAPTLAPPSAPPAPPPAPVAVPANLAPLPLVMEPPKPAASVAAVVPVVKPEPEKEKPTQQAKKKILKKKATSPNCEPVKKVARDAAVPPCNTSTKGEQL